MNDGSGPPRRRGVGAAALAGLALCGAVGACGRSGEPGVVLIDGIAVLRSDGDGAMDASFEGELHEVDGCLVLGRGPTAPVPVWPLDVDLGRRDGRLLVDGHAVGEVVRLGGGEVVDGGSDIVALAHQLCGDRGVWLVAP